MKTRIALDIPQLPLGFSLRDDATFENFLPDANEQVLQSILTLIKAPTDNFLYIWGAAGSGRSHLLQAACHCAPEYNLTAVYLPLAELIKADTDLFLGLENIHLVCIDDIQQIAGNTIWEEQVFHLFNRIRANGHRLLIAADAAPNQLAIKLPDLKSRLSWGVVYQLNLLNDEQKFAALRLHARARGLDLDEPVGKFLLRRCSRNMAQLFNTLELLDQASLAEQRRLTIPFIKRVLGL